MSYPNETTWPHFHTVVVTHLNAPYYRFGAGVEVVDISLDCVETDVVVDSLFERIDQGRLHGLTQILVSAHSLN